MEMADRPEWTLYGRHVRGDALQVGDVFSRFVILDIISITLFGILYEVKDSHSAERLLLHLFPTALSRRVDFSGPLETVISLHESVSDHTVLVPRELLSLEGVIGVVYDGFPGGKTLTQHLEEVSSDHGLPVDEVKRILRKVSRGLEAASQAGLHHLVLNPDNVLINHNDEIRMFGFGWRKIIEPPHFEDFVSGAILPFKRETSPPGYSNLDAMSPEVRNQKSFDARGDIFSVGLLGYYLLTRLRPATEWIPPSQTGMGIDEGWDYLFGRCLEGEVEKRYARWSAFLADLEKVEALGKVARRDKRKEKVLRRLDRMLLPRKLEKRLSGRGKAIVRLVLLGLFGCAVIGVASYCYVTILTDSAVDLPTEASVVAVGLNERANLVLRLDPPNAKVRLLGSGGGQFQTTTGELRLRGTFRDHTFIVSAPDYQSERFTVKLDQTEQVRPVALDLAWARIRIAGLPGSQIFVVSDKGRRAYLDVIPEDGRWVAEDRLLARTYNFVVEKEGYRPARFEGVELSGKWTDLTVEHEPLPTVIRVISQPEGAVVLIDGQEVGRTPLRIEQAEPPETLLVSVVGEGLRLQEQVLSVLPGQENLVDFGDLEQSTGTLSLTVHLRGRLPAPEELEQLRIAVGTADHTAVAQINSSLPSGRHALNVTHPDYFSFEREAAIRDRETTALVVDLAPRPGKLRYLIPDRPHRILIDGEAAEPVGNVVAIPPEREVEVVLTIRDYFPVKRRVLHAPNELEDWYPELRPLPAPEKEKQWKPPYLNMPMVWIPGGEFSMGSVLTEQLRLPNEEPATRMRFSEGFWAGATEVTQETFRRVMGHNPSYSFGSDLPVESVTWDEASEFGMRLTESERVAGRLPEGYVYRLPTEAEWEYLARAGTATPFSFGGAANPNDGNFQGHYPRDYRSGESAQPGRSGTAPVGSYPANPWGLHDVHGNVSEWVYDGYNARLPGGTQTDFVRLEEGRGRAVRGGGWNDLAHRVRSSAREQLSPDARQNSVGFRVVLARELAP